MPTMGPANSQLEARQNWTSYYPFEPYNGGDGVLLSVSSQAVTIMLLGSGYPSNSVQLVSLGPNPCMVKFGGSSAVQATTGSMAIPALGGALISLLNEGQQPFSWMSAICLSGQSCIIQATCGFGGN